MRSVPDAPESQPDGAHSALSRPQDAHDDAVVAAPAHHDDDQPSLLDEPGVTDNADEQHEEQPKKKGRSSVPSWDEIMFGKKD